MSTVIAVMLALSSVANERPLPSNSVSGFFSRYGELPTVATIEYRGIDTSLYDGVVAVVDCSQIGKEAWLLIDGEWYDVIVFDCAGDVETVQWMEESNIIGELGYYLAEEIEYSGGVYGVMTYTNPNSIGERQYDKEWYSEERSCKVV